MFIVMEGLDRTGKSTVAERLEEQGFTVVHMSAPDKKYSQPGYVGPKYIDELLDLYMTLDGQNVVFDRSPRGECVWPIVYGRQPMLTDSDFEVLQEFEDKNDTQYWVFTDDDVEAHWKRCVENKEPLTRHQFNDARVLFNNLAQSLQAELGDMNHFLNMVDNMTTEKIEIDVPTQEDVDIQVDVRVEVEQPKKSKIITPEQQRLARANAINKVLSKRIIKQTEPEFDKIEEEIREFLNNKLSEMLGISKGNSFTDQEIEILKVMCEQVIKRGKQ